MALPGNGSPPIGPRESKAIHTLMTAKEVAEEVERLRRLLSDPHLAPAKAVQSTDEMNDALSRLCNLITLAIAEINENAGEQFRQHFDRVLDEVRGRLLHLNFPQMMERLKAIRNQAHLALQHHDYRLGYAARLERAYGDVVDHLTAMGATEELGLDSQLLAAAIEDIRALAEIEVRVFKLIDFDALPPPRPSPLPEE